MFTSGSISKKNKRKKKENKWLKTRVISSPNFDHGTQRQIIIKIGLGWMWGGQHQPTHSNEYTLLYITISQIFSGFLFVLVFTLLLFAYCFWSRCGEIQTPLFRLLMRWANRNFRTIFHLSIVEFWTPRRILCDRTSFVQFCWLHGASGGATHLELELSMRNQIEHSL